MYLSACRRAFLPAIFLCLVHLHVSAQHVYDTLDIVNWNLEYFGDNDNELPQEMDKARTIMNQIQADIYALVEVVNEDSLNSLVHSINGDYDYIISTFGSFATSPSSPGYASAQKLAFVYRRSMVRNITAGPLLSGSSGNAYYNWSSGRFPYFVQAEVLGADSTWIPIDFVILHAKAMDDATSCDRRRRGCREMKDSLDAYYAQTKLIILGDYNDDLDESICSATTISNYAYLVMDSTDNNSYHALTLPLSKMGLNSIYGYTSFLDHVVVSNEVRPWYIPGSAAVLKDEVNNWVSGYTHYVSDHYPVITRYRFTQAAGINVPSTTHNLVYPNPSGDKIFLSGSADQVVLYYADGRVAKTWLHADQITVSDLPQGLYFMKIWSHEKISTVTIQVMH